MGGTCCCQARPCHRANGFRGMQPKPEFKICPRRPPLCCQFFREQSAPVLPSPRSRSSAITPTRPRPCGRARWRCPKQGAAQQPIEQGGGQRTQTPASDLEKRKKSHVHMVRGGRLTDETNRQNSLRITYLLLEIYYKIK